MCPMRLILCFLFFFPAAIIAKTGLGVDVDFYTGPISNNVWGHLKATSHKFVIAQSWADAAGKNSRLRNWRAPNRQV